MPNSSSALPASRIISRSESLPITTETSGLLMNIRSSEHRYLVLICPLLSLHPQLSFCAKRRTSVPFCSGRGAHHLGAMVGTRYSHYFFSALAAISLRYCPP